LLHLELGIGNLYVGSVVWKGFGEVVIEKFSEVPSYKKFYEGEGINKMYTYANNKNILILRNL